MFPRIPSFSDICPDAAGAEQLSYADVVLIDCLRSALETINSKVPSEAIQEFAPSLRGAGYPQLSQPRNIVFIADEAHRLQYGLEAKLVKSKDDQEAYISYAFAKYLRDGLPNASFIGFTGGTPIEATDKSTPAVFGDYIDIYDI